jgi:PfaD family protein
MFAASNAQPWHGPIGTLAFDEAGARARLNDLHRPVYIVRMPDGRTGVTHEGPETSGSNGSGGMLLAAAPALPPSRLGDPAFQRAYGLRCGVYAGAMANAISSVEMVTALGKGGLLGSFGAAGLSPARLEEALVRLQAALPDGPYAVNLIHSPFDPSMEHRAVELFLRYGISLVEASAFLDLTASLVRYRLAGLYQNPDGSIDIRNRIIAKLSRKEVAARFLQPAPADLVQQLLAEGKITPLQAELAQYVPMADDITAEADSGGHTDNRPLTGLVPTMIALRDELQAKHKFPTPVRIGAAGGISTPSSALAAWMMGAAYVATGSVNQACVEAGASEHTRALLAQAGMADVVMAPSADMFEMGVRVQVLKLGTMFPMRAARLYELYSRYNSIEEIPAVERQRLEKQIFQREMESIWTDTAAFFTERDPSQLARAEKDPHHKMALIFRWYLGLSSRWSNGGEKGREMDYQIWCGPSLGSFNDWTRGTYLADAANRHVLDVNQHILNGSAYQYRTQALKLSGVTLVPSLEFYRPECPTR